MWVVLKYKKNEFSFLKNGFKKTLGELPIIFRPTTRAVTLVILLLTLAYRFTCFVKEFDSFSFKNADTIQKFNYQ